MTRNQAESNFAAPKAGARVGVHIIDGTARETTRRKVGLVEQCRGLPALDALVE